MELCFDKVIQSLTDSYDSESEYDQYAPPLAPIRETMTEDLKSGMLQVPNFLKLDHTTLKK